MPDRDDLAQRLAASVEELERQRSLVLQLNQLKNDLIAVLAHDIKGPLTSIVGFAELLEDGYLEGEAAIDAAKTIRVNANRLATLANDVLALSRVERGELEIADERVDLVDVVKKAIEANALEREIDFQTKVEVAHVRGDAERLVQAFDNLIRNAVRYSPNGDTVGVELTALGDTFVVSVNDRGIGIPQEELAKLFGRFWRGSNARRAKIAGTGVGLFVVKMILERHNGSIEVRSTLDEGSTFEVTLPTFGSGVAAKPKRVTMLTGDPSLSRFVAFELRSRGYRVREVNTLDTAISGDVRSGDVILVDDGSALPAELRAGLAHVSSVHLIGLGVRKSDGWDRILGKPFLVSELLAAVDVAKERASV